MWRVPLAICLFIAFAGFPAWGEPLPVQAGIINVRDYGALGDGQTDDTAAILKAIAASGENTGRTFWQDRIVYLPDGVYRVSDTLLKRYQDGNFASGMILVGQSRERTVIRLIDNARGYADPAQPRAVIFTSSKQLDGTPTSGGKDYLGLGEGNDAYMNFVEDLTIDVGNGNLGATAIDFLANNIGAVRDVTVRAPRDSGAIGLAMTRKWPGPALIQRVTVEGFDTGISVAQTEYGITLEHIRLLGQRRRALVNNQNSLAIRDLVVRGPAPIIANEGKQGFLAIADGRISVKEGRTEIADVFSNAGIVTLRNLVLEPPVAAGAGVSPEFHTGTLQGRASWRPSDIPSWLPSFADSPSGFRLPLDQWVNARQFGAVPDPAFDSTEGLRRAFASGASIVYLPHGTYAISDSLEIPPTLRRLAGMNSTIRILPARNPSFARSSGMLRVASAGEPLSIERLALDNTNLGQQLGIEISGARPVTVQDVVSAGVALADRKPDGGPVFFENVCCGRLSLAGPNPAYARQLNTEGGGTRIVNRGSPLSVLGFKTEGISTILDASEGARSDLFGGLVYMVRDSPAVPVPAFRNIDSWLAASFAEESLRPASRYSLYLASENGNGGTDIGAESFPPRGFGRIVPDLTAIPRPQ